MDSMILVSIPAQDILWRKKCKEWRQLQMEQAESEFAAAGGKFASGCKGSLVTSASHTHQKAP